jgi:hypothetical protein
MTAVPGGARTARLAGDTVDRAGELEVAAEVALWGIVFGWVDGLLEGVRLRPFAEIRTKFTVSL